MHIAQWETGDWAAIATVVAFAVTGFIGFRRRILPWWRSLSRQTTAAIETIVGRDAIHDAATGRELVPAQPGLGVRIASLEETVAALAKQSARMDTIERLQLQHSELISLNTAEIAALKRAEAERIATRAESAQMWRAIAENAPDLAPPTNE